MSSWKDIHKKLREGLGKDFDKYDVYKLPEGDGPMPEMGSHEYARGNVVESSVQLDDMLPGPGMAVGAVKGSKQAKKLVREAFPELDDVLGQWVAKGNKFARNKLAEIGAPLQPLQNEIAKKLSAWTDVRKNWETGDHEFRLYRGRDSLNAEPITSRKSSSWTPDIQVAKQFAGIDANARPVTEAWIPLSKVRNVPNLWGDFRRGGRGSMDLQKEREVIVSGLHPLTETRVVLQSPPEKTVPALQDIHQTINRRAQISRLHGRGVRENHMKQRYRGRVEVPGLNKSYFDPSPKQALEMPPPPGWEGDWDPSPKLMREMETLFGKKPVVEHPEDFTDVVTGQEWVKGKKVPTLKELNDLNEKLKALQGKK